MDDNVFIKIVKESISMAYAAKCVGMAFSTFKRRAEKLDCYLPNPSGKGISKKKKNKIPLSDILEGKCPQYATYKLKIRLYEAKIFEDKCYRCGWSKKANGRKYSACELEHENGNPTDHRLINLTILCPNCHSLTKIYRFRRGKTNGIEH